MALPNRQEEINHVLMSNMPIIKKLVFKVIQRPSNPDPYPILFLKLVYKKNLLVSGRINFVSN